MRGGELSREVGLARRTCSMPVEGGATVTLEGGGNGDHDGYLRTFSFFSHSAVTFMA
jgi:hypothetical protein